MSGEIKPIKDLARNVKALALQRAQRILEHPEDYDAKLYNETYLTVLKNAVPRSQEISGEDGGVIKLVFDSSFNPNGTLQQTESDQPQQSPIQDSEGGS
jgi:hypothetical protein